MQALFQPSFQRTVQNHCTYLYTEHLNYMQQLGQVLIIVCLFNNYVMLGRYKGLELKQRLR